MRPGSERQMRKADARCRRDVLRTRQPLTIRDATHVFNGRQKIFNVKMLLPNSNQFQASCFIFFFLKIKQSRDWANEYLYSTKFLRVQISCTIITNANQVKWPILPHLESGSFAYDLGPLESARYPQSNVGRLIKHSADFFLQIIIAHLHTTLSMNLNSFGENLYIVVRWSNKTQTFSRNDAPE